MVQEIIERAIRGLEEALEKEWARLRHHYPRHHWCRRKVKAYLCIVINKQKYIPMGNLVLQLPPAGSPAQGFPVVDVLADAATLAALTTQSYVRKSLTSDNPKVIAIDENGNLVFGGATGVANITADDVFAYTDQDDNEQVTDKEETPILSITVTSGPEAVVAQLNLAAPVAAGAQQNGSWPAPAAAPAAQAAS